MNGLEVEFARSARKELERLLAKIVERSIEAIRDLVEHPHPPGTLKLAGTDDLYRIRVGSYRIVYQVDETRGRIVITRVRHRKDAYQS
jgi:mRNA interferase RelE/StbE